MGEEPIAFISLSDAAVAVIEQLFIIDAHVILLSRWRAVDAPAADSARPVEDVFHAYAKVAVVERCLQQRATVLFEQQCLQHHGVGGEVKVAL